MRRFAVGSLLLSRVILLKVVTPLLFHSFRERSDLSAAAALYHNGMAVEQNERIQKIFAHTETVERSQRERSKISVCAKIF